MPSQEVTHWRTIKMRATKHKDQELIEEAGRRLREANIRTAILKRADPDQPLDAAQIERLIANIRALGDRGERTGGGQ